MLTLFDGYQRLGSVSEARLSGVLKQGPMRITGADAEGEIRVIEWPDHPFFIGTLFVPQTRSTPEQPHPLVSAFLSAVSAS